MAVAYDASSALFRTDTSTNPSWTHTPTGTPRGVVVFSVHGTTAIDHVDGVTYGGVALGRISRVADLAGEVGEVLGYFVGTGIPTGAQTVAVALDSATTTDIHFVCITLTASDDTEVIDFDITETGDQADPSATLQYSGRTAIAVAGLYMGGSSPAAFTPNGNCTTAQDQDLGNFYSEVIYQTTPGTSDFAIGGTSSSDDVAMLAVAISEVIPSGVSAAPGVGVLTLTGLAPTAAVTAHVSASPGVGVLTVTGLAPTAFGADAKSASPGVGALTVTGLAPTVSISAHVAASPGVGALTVTGLEPTAAVTAHVAASPGVGALTVAGLAPTASTTAHVSASPAVGELTLTGLAPTASTTAHVSASPGVGELTVSGLAPTATVGTGTTAEAAPGVGVLTLAGLAPTAAVTAHVSAAPGTGEVTVTGLVPTVTAIGTASAAPGTGALIVTGYAPTVEASDSQSAAATPGTGELVIIAFAPTVVITSLRALVAEWRSGVRYAATARSASLIVATAQGSPYRTARHSSESQRLATPASSPLYDLTRSTP
jgi:hypothetical protein